MNKEALESKVAELFNKSEEEKNEVFSLFKEKIATFLNVGEAIRIEGLGVFQLKEQLAHSDTEKPLSSADKTNTLVYSPESDQASGDSLFMNLELERKLKDDSEFDENVFQLGIGKPVATISDKEILDGDSSGDISDALDKSMTILLNDSEKLQNFDLWEDYLKNKETKSVIEDEAVIDEIVDSVTDEEIEIENKKSLLDDFEPLGEEELLNNYIEDNDFINDDEINKIVDEIDSKEPEFEIPNDELITDDIDEEFEESSIDTQDILDELNEDSDRIEENITDNVINEIDEIELENKIDEEVVEELKEDVIEDETIDEISEVKDDLELKIEESVEIDELESKDVIEDDIVKEEIAAFKKEGEVRYIHAKKRRSPIIYMLIVAFLLIGAIGMYYLFFDNPTWLYDEHEVEVQLSQQHAQQLEDAKQKALEENETKAIETDNKTETKKVEDDQEDKLEKTEDSKKIVVKTKVEEPNENTAKVELKKKTSKSLDQEVAENIYFDGNDYNVQVSSWKQEKFAKLEVSKLEKKGLSAYFVKVFIPKFNSTWHRVRIGPFSTLDEAKQNQKKNKK